MGNFTECYPTLFISVQIAVCNTGAAEQRHSVVQKIPQPSLDEKPNELLLAGLIFCSGCLQWRGISLLSWGCAVTCVSRSVTGWWGEPEAYLKGRCWLWFLGWAVPPSLLERITHPVWTQLPCGMGWDRILQGCWWGCTCRQINPCLHSST